MSAVVWPGRVLAMGVSCLEFERCATGGLGLDRQPWRGCTDFRRLGRLGSDGLVGWVRTDWLGGVQTDWWGEGAWINMLRSNGMGLLHKEWVGRRQDDRQQLLHRMLCTAGYALVGHVHVSVGGGVRTMQHTHKHGATIRAMQGPHKHGPCRTNTSTGHAGLTQDRPTICAMQDPHKHGPCRAHTSTGPTQVACVCQIASAKDSPRGRLPAQACHGKGPAVLTGRVRTACGPVMCLF
eukprot:243122-Chlamydomonas_euryale.AAC.4